MLIRLQIAFLGYLRTNYVGPDRSGPTWQFFCCTDRGGPVRSGPDRSGPGWANLGQVAPLVSRQMKLNQCRQAVHAGLQGFPVGRGGPRGDGAVKPLLIYVLHHRVRDKVLDGLPA